LAITYTLEVAKFAMIYKAKSLLFESYSISNSGTLSIFIAITVLVKEQVRIIILLIIATNVIAIVIYSSSLGRWLFV